MTAEIVELARHRTVAPDLPVAFALLDKAADDPGDLFVAAVAALTSVRINLAKPVSRTRDRHIVTGLAVAFLALASILGIPRGEGAAYLEPN